MGIPLNTLASATKFEWWLANDPGIQKAAQTGALRLGTPDSWLTACLSGGRVHVTDPSSASSTALFDGSNMGWSEMVLQVFGVPADALPEIVPTSGIVAETPRELLGVSIPVAARAGDQQAAAFAQGVHLPGEAKLTLGTSGMLDVHTGTEMRDPAPGAYSLALWMLPDGSRSFCMEGTVITAGAAVDWLVSVGLAPNAAEVDALAREVTSAEGVRFVPSFQGLGTPFLDDAATGLLGGLTRGAGRAQISRAVLEGIAHRCVDVCDALELGPIPLRVDGGLARSQVLVQSMADFGGRAVERAAETETTALGAAYLAGLSTGIFEGLEACRSAIVPPQRFEPEWDEARRVEARELWAKTLERVRRSE
jgi:glycerol kinase